MLYYNTILALPSLQTLFITHKKKRCEHFFYPIEYKNSVKYNPSLKRFIRRRESSMRETSKALKLPDVKAFKR